MPNVPLRLDPTNTNGYRNAKHTHGLILSRRRYRTCEVRTCRIRYIKNLKSRIRDRGIEIISTHSQTATISSHRNCVNERKKVGCRDNILFFYGVRILILATGTRKQSQEEKQNDSRKNLFHSDFLF